VYAANSGMLFKENPQGKPFDGYVLYQSIESDKKIEKVIKKKHQSIETFLTDKNFFYAEITTSSGIHELTKKFKLKNIEYPIFLISKKHPHDINDDDKILVWDWGTFEENIEKDKMTNELMQTVADVSDNNTIEKLITTSKNSLIRIKRGTKGLLEEDENNEYESCNKIFLSYASKDRGLMQSLKSELEAQLAAYSTFNFEIWTDQEINIGDHWNKIINVAINKSKAAILLVSAKFLNSKFIKQKELAKILRRKRDEGYILFPILIRDCPFEEFEKLSKLQFFKTYGSDYERFDEWRDKLYPFEELVEVEKPIPRLQNRYAKKLAEEIVKAFS